MAQADALLELHAEYCAVAAAPPKVTRDGSPFEPKVHTANAILCGDFNHAPDEPEHAAIMRPSAQGRLWDSWALLNGNAPHAPTFQLFDRTYGPAPLAYDFVFVSDGLKDKLRSLNIDSATQASDHQPLFVELG
jgi:endonuclease/exonuclease/phosphatase family metal-dependent hydrolase